MQRIIIELGNIESVLSRKGRSSDVSIARDRNAVASSSLEERGARPRGLGVGEKSDLLKADNSVLGKQAQKQILQKCQ